MLIPISLHWSWSCNCPFHCSVPRRLLIQAMEGLIQTNLSHKGISYFMLHKVQRLRGCSGSIGEIAELAIPSRTHVLSTCLHLTIFNLGLTCSWREGGFTDSKNSSLTRHYPEAWGDNLLSLSLFSRLRKSFPEASQDPSPHISQAKRFIDWPTVEDTHSHENKILNLM